MLVLTRKRGETIRIGNDIVLKVIQIGRGTIKLGIEAPSHVRVLRGELQPFAASDKPPAESDAEARELELFLSEFGDLFDIEFDSAESRQMHLESAALAQVN